MSANTKKKIMNAALIIFAEEGYKGARTKKIALAAGVNEATIFRIYGSKENLFKQLLTQNSKILTIIDTLKEADEDEDIETKLIQVATLYKQMFNANPYAAKIFYRCAIDKEDLEFLSGSFGTKAYSFLVDYFEMMQEKEKIILKPTAAEAAFYFLGMIHGSLQRQLIFEELKEDVDMGLLVSIFLGGISAK